MFGLTPEATLGLISTAGGIVSGFLLNQQKIKAKAAETQIKLLAAQTEYAAKRSAFGNEEFKTRTRDVFSSLTRRIFVLMITSAVVLMMFAPLIAEMLGITMGTAVPVERTTGGSYLFGLIDTTKTEVVYEVIQQAMVTPQYLKELMIMIGTFYLGLSGIKQK